MDIAILNYPTGEVDILRNIDDKFYNDVEMYLEDVGYNVNDIFYMCNDGMVINDDKCS